MKTYRILNTDIDVSRLAYGTWHLGGSWDDTPLSQDVRDRAETLIHTAVDAGITLIDLADIYTRGKSDEVVGHVLKQTPGLRDRIVLQAKCGIVLGSDTQPAHYNFEAEHIVSALEGTLSRLGVDHVELLLLHRPDPLVEPEEVARAFDQLHQAGKVRWFGVSNHTSAQIELLKTAVEQPIVINQLEVSLLHNNLIRDGVVANTTQATYTATHGTLEYCRAHDIQIQAWSPVARGDLFAPPDDAPHHVMELAAEIRRMADQHDTTTESIAIGWLLRHPAGILPILGTMTPERIGDSCRADDLQMSRAEWYRLFELANGESVP